MEDEDRNVRRPRGFYLLLEFNRIEDWALFCALIRGDAAEATIQKQIDAIVERTKRSNDTLTDAVDAASNLA